MDTFIAADNRHRPVRSFAQRCVDLANWLGLIYALGLLALLIQHIFLPQRDGTLALTQVFEPYFFLPLLLALPFVLRRRSLMTLNAIGMCFLIGAIRLLPTWVSLPPSETQDAYRFSAATWNMYVANHNLDELPRAVTNAQPDILAVQELTPQHQAALEADPRIAERYPWRYLMPGHSDGMGILSRFPILEQGILRNPARRSSFPIVWARVDPGAGRTLMVVTAHPRAPHTPFRQPMPLPRTFDTSGRAADIAFLRGFIDRHLRNNEALLVLGDFNLTEYEPDYQDATAGLIDAHLQAGIGSGNTWILSSVRTINAGLLRIDYLLSSPQVRPLRTSVDCSMIGSDHCLVRGVFEIN